MTRIVHLLLQLAVIAVPATGWFVQDWAGGTTLVVYWFETLAACLFVAARIAVHQRWTPRRGHFRYHAPSAQRRSTQKASFITGFVITSFAFCAVHGIFLAAILFLLNRRGSGQIAEVDWHSVGFGCASVMVFLTLDFVVDLFGLHRWSFWQVERTAYRGLSRVVVVHLTLLIGLFGIALTGAPDTLFGTFVVLKTLFSLSWLLPQWQPAAPPKWLARLMNRVPRVKLDRTFEEQWASDDAEENERREENEQPWVR